MAKNPVVQRSEVVSWLAEEKALLTKRERLAEEKRAEVSQLESVLEEIPEDSPFVIVVKRMPTAYLGTDGKAHDLPNF